MHLRDILSHANLTLFPEVGLILFLIVFVAIALRVVRSGDIWDGAAALPLDEGAFNGTINQSEERS